MAHMDRRQDRRHPIAKKKLHNTICDDMTELEKDCIRPRMSQIFRC